MTPVQALILGLLQGLTEFLPVSSSGHLVIAQSAFALQTPPVLFDTLVHLSTLFAVLVFFRTRLLSLNLVQLKLVAIASIPAFVAGIFLNPFLEQIFSSLPLVSAGLFFTGVLLLSTRIPLSTKPTSPLSPTPSLLIGLFQALAIIPGISRSGATVSSALHLGIKRQDAFYFSFLIAIPAITGAFVLQLPEISLSALRLSPLIIGFLSSFFSGIFALKLLQLVIAKSKLHYFSFYCFALSFLLLLHLVS